MFRITFICLLLLSAFFPFKSKVWAQQGNSTAEPIRLIERTEKISEYQLSNGLRLLLMPDRSTPVVTVMILYHVGSRNEAVGHTGATHMLEHLLFKGTPAFNKERGTQLAAILESIGADYNASTWYDRTNYYQTLPSDKLELALELEADRMRNALIRDSDRAAEMTVVRNELEQSENDPATVLDLQVYATAFREHPYHHPTNGWRSDVEGVPTARLKAFYDTFYWPNNATLLLIGDFTEANALALVDKHFSAIPSSSTAIPPVYTVEPKQQGERRFVLRRDGELAIVEMAWHTTHGRDQDIYPLILLNTILTRGLTSRLHQALVEKQLAVEVSANADRLYDPGLFEIFVTLRPDVKPADVEQVVHAELARLKTDFVTKEELNRAKTLILADFAYHSDGPAGIADELTEAISNGDWHIYLNFPKNIQQTSAEQIQAVVKRYFYDDNLTIGYFQPTEATANGENSTPTGKAQLLPTQVGGPAYWRDKSKPKELTGAPALTDTPISRSQSVTFAERIKRVEMSNGAALLMLERRTSPTVAITGTLLAGDYLDPHDKPYIAYMVAEMLNKGIARRNKLELASELENIGAEIDFDASTFTLNINGRCLSKDVEKVITLLAEMLCRPTFAADELEKLKTQTIAQLRQKLEDTDLRAYERLTQLIYEPTHPLYQKPIEARIKSINSITQEDIRRFYKAHYGGASLILAIVGDIEAATIERLVRDRFADWSGGHSKKLQVPETVRQKVSRRELIPMKDKANADIYIGHAGGLRRNSPDYYAAILANNALGQSTLSSRLGLRVRDTEGLTYGIISRFFSTGFANGPWAISVSVNPENVDKAVASSLQVVREYIESGIGEKELAAAKGSLIGSFKVRLATNAGLATRLMEIELYNLGLDFLDRYPQIIESINKAEVDEAIRRHFHPEQVTVVVAGEVSTSRAEKK
ncbi:MAG: pitrilysin family protein [Acidobacteriota bacterium]